MLSCRKPAGSDAQECSDAARKAGEIATGLGVKHVVVPGEPAADDLTIRQFAKIFRKQNYEKMMDECQRQNIETLLFGHNHDDYLGRRGLMKCRIGDVKLVS